MNLLTWKHFLSNEKTQPYFKKILHYILLRKKKGITIYPKKKHIFEALKATPFQNVKVVIIGQDPYSQPKQAHGLAFSVQPNVSIPPSLINIYKELLSDIPNFSIPKHGYLKSWTKEGILLLNSILTVEKGTRGSHAHIGWENFTDKIISIINIHKKNIIFLLWGTHAHKKEKLIDPTHHYILKTSHPSPLSARYGFFGCKHFSKTNELLLMNSQKIINWQPKLL